MNLDDIKDVLRDRLLSAWGDLQESPAYNTLKERYETLPATTQKLLLTGVALLAALMLLMIPYSYLSSASDNVGHYDETRQLMTNMFKASRIDSGPSPLPAEIPAAELESLVKRALDSAQLVSEQIGDIKVTNGKGTARQYARPPIQAMTVEVPLKQLNLQQIVTVGNKLQNMSPAVKMIGLHVTADRQHKNYFNVSYQLARFALPVEPKAPNRPRKGH